MKKMMLMIVALTVGFSSGLQAQKSGKAKTSKTVQKKTASTKAPAKKQAAATDTVVSLTSASANQAYGPASGQRFTISDPLVTMLNQQAAGSQMQVSRSGIVGMPKRTYGFANGKILLRNTTATTPGTSYGSGAVATGTTILGVGASENAIGVNGKSPYAGPWLWGSKHPGQNLPISDSSRRKE